MTECTRWVTIVVCRRHTLANAVPTTRHLPAPLHLFVWLLNQTYSQGYKSPNYTSCSRCPLPITPHFGGSCEKEILQKITYCSRSPLPSTPHFGASEARKNCTAECRGEAPVGTHPADLPWSAVSLRVTSTGRPAGNTFDLENKGKQKIHSFIHSFALGGLQYEKNMIVMSSTACCSRKTCGNPMLINRHTERDREIEQ